MLVENLKEHYSREIGKEAPDVCLPRVAAPRFRGSQMMHAMVEAVSKAPGHAIAMRLIRLARQEENPKKVSKKRL